MTVSPTAIRPASNQSASAAGVRLVAIKEVTPGEPGGRLQPDVIRKLQPSARVLSLMLTSPLHLYRNTC